MDKCQCPAAGYCPFMKKQMVGRLYELCQTRADYRELWLRQAENLQETSPSIIEKATGFVKAVAEHAKSGFKEVTESVYQQRLTVCGGCEHFNKNNSSCKLCGCRLKMKAKWASAKCPDNRWES